MIQEQCWWHVTICQRARCIATGERPGRQGGRKVEEEEEEEGETGFSAVTTAAEIESTGLSFSVSNQTSVSNKMYQPQAPSRRACLQKWTWLTCETEMTLEPITPAADLFSTESLSCALTPKSASCWSGLLLLRDRFGTRCNQGHLDIAAVGEEDVGCFDVAVDFAWKRRCMR
jgi:hypothetical protein